jgi:hypothetical protein
VGRSVPDGTGQKKRKSVFRLASFHFETPTGFDPCGTIFGAVRQFYAAPCKAFADDVDRPNRIIWYEAPEHAIFYEEPHVFTPGIDRSGDPLTSALYEYTTVRTNERKHFSGINTFGTTGLHFHGDPEDFMGEALKAKYGVAPPDPCAAIPLTFSRLLLRTLVRTPPDVITSTPSGLGRFLFRGTLVGSGVDTLTSRILFKGVSVGAPPSESRHGILFKGGFLEDTPIVGRFVFSGGAGDAPIPGVVLFSGIGSTAGGSGPGVPGVVLFSGIGSTAGGSGPGVPGVVLFSGIGSTAGGSGPGVPGVVLFSGIGSTAGVSGPGLMPPGVFTVGAGGTTAGPGGTVAPGVFVIGAGGSTAGPGGTLAPGVFVIGAGGSTAGPGGTLAPGVFVIGAGGSTAGVGGALPPGSFTIDAGGSTGTGSAVPHALLVIGGGGSTFGGFDPGGPGSFTISGDGSLAGVDFPLTPGTIVIGLDGTSAGGHTLISGGTDCYGAALLAAGTDYETTLVPGVEQWFRIPQADFVAAHFDIASDTNVAGVYYGGECPSLLYFADQSGFNFDLTVGGGFQGPVAYLRLIPNPGPCVVHWRYDVP